MVVEILRFHDFQNESRPPCLCFQIKISNGCTQSWQTHSVASSEISSRSVKSLQKYGDLSLFFKMAAGCHLDLLDTYLDHRIKYCAKFGWNRCSSFENIKVFFRFCVLSGLKKAIQAPKTGGFGGWYPWNGKLYRDLLLTLIVYNTCSNWANEAFTNGSLQIQSHAQVPTVKETMQEWKTSFYCQYIVYRPTVHITRTSLIHHFQHYWTASLLSKAHSIYFNEYLLWISMRIISYQVNKWPPNARANH